MTKGEIVDWIVIDANRGPSGVIKLSLMEYHPRILHSHDKWTKMMKIGWCGHGSCWWGIKDPVKALSELIWTWIYTQRLPHITCGTLSLSEAPWVQQVQNIMMTWVGLEARLNRYKLIILIQIVVASKCVSESAVVWCVWVGETILIGCDLSYSEREC